MLTKAFVWVWILQFLVVLINTCCSGAIVTKQFTKTVTPALTLTVSGYTRLSGTRRIDCAQQCSQDDACIDFYYTLSGNICYLSDSSSSSMYTIQTGNFAYFKVNDPIGCPRNNGEWYTLEKESNLMFSLFTSADVNFVDAVSNCASIGGHPLQILTDDKMTFVKEKLLPCPDVNGYHYWVDATNALPSTYDVFKTTDNKVFPVSGGPFWEDENGPNDGTYQPLCMWLPSFFGYKFDDIQCVYPGVKHICEKIKT